MVQQIEKWDYFELSLQGETTGNPFLDVEYKVDFTYKNRTIQVSGFYDGDGTFKARLMPDVEGVWHYRTSSNVSALNNVEGDSARHPRQTIMAQ